MVTTTGATTRPGFSEPNISLTLSNLFAANNFMSEQYTQLGRQQQYSNGITNPLLSIAASAINNSQPPASVAETLIRNLIDDAVRRANLQQLAAAASSNLTSDPIIQLILEAQNPNPVRMHSSSLETSSISPGNQLLSILAQNLNLNTVQYPDPSETNMIGLLLSLLSGATSNLPQLHDRRP
jgi:hypothetical protein